MPERIEPQAFWTWAYSDFLSNALRGVLAEYIVSRALGFGAPGKVAALRTEWDAYDLLSPSGQKIEVKSSAYLQSWVQKKPSVLRFDIAPKRGWDARTNILSSEVGRQADLYVFCVFAEPSRERADPLDLSQWFFLVCPVVLLDQHFGPQKSLSLAALERLGLARLDFAELTRNLEPFSR